LAQQWENLHKEKVRKGRAKRLGMNLKVVLVRLLPMKWSLTINRRTKGDGKGKGKSANSEEKEKARIAVPSLRLPYNPGTE